MHVVPENDVQKGHRMHVVPGDDMQKHLKMHVVPGTDMQKANIMHVVPGEEMLSAGFCSVSGFCSMDSALVIPLLCIGPSMDPRKYVCFFICVATFLHGGTFLGVFF